MEIIYCKRCLMSSSRPRIVFNEEGICNACVNAERKKNRIDWNLRRDEFLRVLDRYRARDGSWDCVVPWSGGKDSSYVAYRLKFEFGMNPVLVTFSPVLLSDIGIHNREALVQKGFDHYMCRPDQRVARHLARRFFIERGNQKTAWDAGINAVPIGFAIRHGLKLIFYAEHGESEYGGLVLGEDFLKRRHFTEIVEHFIGDNPINWTDDEIRIHDLNPYLLPRREVMESTQLDAFFFSYFFPWSAYQNFQYIRDKIAFRTCPEGRTQGTFTDFDSLDDKTDNLYYYMQFIKFGFGRAVRDASRRIYDGSLTREEGLDMVRKYDSEFPSRYLEENLEYLGLTFEEFTDIVDRHRNPEVWTCENNRWKLRFPPQ